MRTSPISAQVNTTVILLANSDRGPFGRNPGKLGSAGKANPRRQIPRAEFANSINGSS
jgi:hypothetical protein